MKTERKMLIAIALVAIILLNCFLPVLQVAASTDVKIVLESNLYEALKDELTTKSIKASYIDEQRTIIINEEEIAKVTELSLSNKELTDLTGLEVFTNLSILDLSSNELNKDSNLGILSLLNLSFLDLSSNEIEDVSMITNLDSIQTINLHNQKFDIVHIIELDTSNESDQVTQVSFKIPQIIRKAGYLETEWLIEETSGVPYINWSRFDHETIKVEVASKSGSSYVPYKSMVTLRINISDSSNILYNSDINMFFIVVDSEERGIHIKDENMYKAIKEQLTINQQVNEDLLSYYTEANNIRRNLYERNYDEPQVLVITINDIINEIPSLKLSNKKIKRLDGIEKFVGLEKELDLSGNYIKTLDKLIELQENQEIEEQKLIERVAQKLSSIAETVAKIDEINNSMKKEQNTIEELKKKKNELEQKRVKLEEELVNLRAEKATLEDEIAILSNDIEEIQSNVKILQDEKEAINETIAAKNKELIDDKTEKEKLQQQLTNLKEELNTLNEELKDLKDNLKDLESNSEIGVLEQAIAQKKIDIDTLENRIKSIVNQKTETENSINIKDGQITETETAIAELETRINDLKSQINVDEEKKAEYESEIEDKEDRIAEIDEEILTAEEDYADTIKQLNAAQLASMITTDDEIAELIEDTLRAHEDTIDDADGYTNSEKSDIYDEVEWQLESYVTDIYDQINEKMDDISALVMSTSTAEADFKAEFNELDDLLLDLINFVERNDIYEDLICECDGESASVDSILCEEGYWYECEECEGYGEIECKTITQEYYESCTAEISTECTAMRNITRWHCEGCNAQRGNSRFSM